MSNKELEAKFSKCINDFERDKLVDRYLIEHNREGKLNTKNSLNYSFKTFAQSKYQRKKEVNINLDCIIL